MKTGENDAASKVAGLQVSAQSDRFGQLPSQDMQIPSGRKGLCEEGSGGDSTSAQDDMRLLFILAIGHVASVRLHAMLVLALREGIGCTEAEPPENSLCTDA